MRTAIYTRVSTGDQVDRSIPAQVAACKRYAADKGWTVTHQFSDEGISAWSGKTRPGLDDAERTGKAGEYDVLVVDSFDRLSRGTANESVLGLVYRFMPAQVESVSEPMPFDAVAREVMLVIHGATAAQESTRKSERSKRGAEGRKAKGLPPGRAPLGYVVVGEKMVTDDRATVVQRIFREFNEGTPQQAIARGLETDGVATPGGGKHWTQAAVRNILRNPAYKGQPHTAIVSEEDWNAAQSRFTTGGKGGGRTSRTHLLSRLLVCECDETMLVRAEHVGSNHYATYLCPRAAGRIPGDCSMQPIRRDALDQAVLDHFVNHAVDLEASRAAYESRRSLTVEQLTVNLNAAKAALATRTAADERVVRAYLDDRLDENAYQAARALSEPERVAAEQAVERAERALDAAEAAPMPDVESKVHDALDGLRATVRDGISDDDVPKLRAQLERVFSRFYVVVGDGQPLLDEFPGDGPANAIPTPDGVYLVPEVRGTLYEDDRDVTPVVERLPLTIGSRQNNKNGLDSHLFWPYPILVATAA